MWKVEIDKIRSEKYIFKTSLQIIETQSEVCINQKMIPRHM